MFKQKGLSLVELMIAVALGLILLTGVIEVFLSSKRVFSTQQAVSRVQETGRLAVDFLSKDIRMAGYMGCASRAADMSITNTLKNSGTLALNFNDAVIAYAAANLPVGSISKVPTADTDILIVRGAAGTGVEVTKSNDSAQVFVSELGTEAGACSDGKNRVSGICPGDILVIADCVKARVFMTTSIKVSGDEANLVHSGTSTYSPGNDITSWGGSSNKMENFDPGAEVLLATTRAYYIATGTSGRPSLWVETNGANPLELLEGVENMSLRFGVDTDAEPDYTPNEYKTAAQVTAAAQWTRVISIQVSLLVASAEDKVLPETQVYSFAGVDNVNPGDQRLRQVFNATVGIRSRLY